jgi:mycothiol system anti-sigma-R factor
MADGNCDDALHELYGFLDGELTSDRKAAISAHLDDCPPCFEAFDFEAELRLVIARKCQETVPESLKVRIADAIRSEQQPSSFSTSTPPYDPKP